MGSWGWMTPTLWLLLISYSLPWRSMWHALNYEVSNVHSSEVVTIKTVLEGLAQGTYSCRVLSLCLNWGDSFTEIYVWGYHQNNMLTHKAVLMSLVRSELWIVPMSVSMFLMVNHHGIMGEAGWRDVRPPNSRRYKGITSYKSVIISTFSFWK